MAPEKIGGGVNPEVHNKNKCSKAFSIIYHMRGYGKILKTIFKEGGRQSGVETPEVHSLKESSQTFPTIS